MTDYRLFPTNPTPSTVDSGYGAAITVGIRFRVTSVASVTTIWFYKASASFPTHVGGIWTDAGALQGSVTFTGETTSGWQSMAFSTPIALTVGAYYRAGVYMPTGHFSRGPGALASAITNGPLNAPAGGAGNQQSCFIAPGSGLTFPNTWESTDSYAIDITVSDALAAPAAPTGLTATPVSSPQINLTWTASTGSPTGYSIERCAGVSCSSFAEIGTAVATTFSDTGLLGNTSYSYRVRATNAGGFSGYSSTATAITLASRQRVPLKMMATSSVDSAKIVDGAVASVDLAAGAAASNVGTLSGVLGGTLPSPTLAAGSVTTTEIADGTIATIDIGNLQVTSGKLASGAAASNVGTLSGVLGGTLPSPTMAAGAAATNVGTLGGSLSGTLPNPTLAANSVGASQITDGTVGTAELAAGAVTNAKLAADTARLNLLTNGGMEIWQRGSGPFAGGGYAADRWAVSLAYSSTLSASRDAVNIDGIGSYATALTYVGPGNGPAKYIQTIEGYTTNYFANRTLAFSIRVKTSVANTARVTMYPGSGANYLTGTVHTGNGAWQTLTWTGTLGADTTGGLLFGVEGYGANATIYVDNAMLVVGSQAADYAPLHPADDLARCFRYYENTNVNAAGSLIIRTYSAGANQQMGGTMEFKARKAVTPTVTLIGSFNVSNAVAPSVGGIGLDYFDFYSSGVASGYAIVYNNAGAGYVAEANP